MENEAKLDTVIFWTDHSSDSDEIRKLFDQAGLNYEERSVDQAEKDDLISPPTLQTHSYRYSGLLLLQAFATSPSMSLEDIVEADRLSYMVRVETEENMRQLFHNPNFKLDWPYWSVRH